MGFIVKIQNLVVLVGQRHIIVILRSWVKVGKKLVSWLKTLSYYFRAFWVHVISYNCKNIDWDV